MIANCSNLIITVKPANQRAALAATRRDSFTQFFESHQSAITGSDDDVDEILDLTNVQDDVSNNFNHN